MTARLAVIGDPIEHSKSPLIHAQFGHQLGIDLRYKKIHVTGSHLTAFLDEFFESGGMGLNITVPHKESVFQWVRHRTPVAETAGAVNTLSVASNGIWGDNTDGAGLVLDLNRLSVPLTGARVLMLGAGGAARGALGPLLAQNPACLHIENRTRAKAMLLAEQVGGQARPEDDEAPYDLIIGASSAGLSGQAVTLPKHLIGPQTWVYDMIYSDLPTPLMNWGTELGAQRCVDGLGMLVGQAAIAFERWFEVLPDPAPVLKKLRPSG